MRVLLSTIGSRGDVQPLVALAMHLRVVGADVHLCVPPDFRTWLEGLGFQVTPIGPELKAMTTGQAGTATAPPSPEQWKQLAMGTVAMQFETITAAARGCDVIVGATALQIAARSVAERMGIRYVFAAYCPAVLPSPLHAPPLMAPPGAPASPETVDHRSLWDQDARRFNELFGAALNAHRASAGLGSVDDVRSHIFTDQPWLAADPTLGPWPDRSDPNLLQTGAWIVPDDRALSPELERFLDAGEPPVYFGFGSMHAAADLGKSLVEAARAVGRRAIVSRGWAELSIADGASDCMPIGEVNQQALFRRVAAVVHHGGAGTTTVAALSGAPQIVVPQLYDQHYWARRVHELGIGSAHAPGVPTTDSVTRALDLGLKPDVKKRAESIASAVRRDGAEVAARRLLATA
jgi:vancomycin aglycone glucosyltransferase